MKVLWFLRLGLAGLMLNLRPVDAANCGPRVRKDWEKMTPIEKTTYKNAVAAAMDSGAYIKFIEFHTEMQSNREAHKHCMFIYWHRFMLLGYENMLRDQGAAYACVTVPYFNMMAASARMTSGACNSFESCAPMLSDIGGSTGGVQRDLLINGVNTRGQCVNTPPLNHFCELSSLKGSQCARCVSRGDWRSIQIPASSGYASVRAQIFNGANIGQMSPLVEKGCHNGLHNVLKGVMSTKASPADLLFYSIHSAVDLMEVIFFKCRVGTKRLTFAQKASHPVAWANCTRENGGLFRPTDPILMRTGEKGVNPVSVVDDPVIGKYFKGLPNQYAGMMDVRDLGEFSYGYQVSGEFATMFVQCDQSPTSRKLQETNATSSPAMCDMGNDGYDANGVDYASQNNFPETEYKGKEDGHVDVMIVDESGNVISPDTPRDAYYTDKSEKKVVDWYDEAMKDMGGDSHENMMDMERQACMFQEVCFGGIEDYPPEFQETWGVTEPRCKTIVDAIKKGTEAIQFKKWREVMEGRFGCPQPTKNTTNMTSTTQVLEANGSLSLTGTVFELEKTSIVTVEGKSVIQSDSVIQSLSVIQNGSVIQNDIVIQNGSVIENGSVIQNDIVIQNGSVIQNDTVIQNGIVSQNDSVIQNDSVVQNDSVIQSGDSDSDAYKDTLA